MGFSWFDVALSDSLCNTSHYKQVEFKACLQAHGAEIIMMMHARSAVRGGDWRPRIVYGRVLVGLKITVVGFEVRFSVKNLLRSGFR
ncbi:hypothetical protein SDJN03_01959, partial [Cucurbita argyrosperma subsp. sororia]